MFTSFKAKTLTCGLLTTVFLFLAHTAFSQRTITIDGNYKVVKEFPPQLTASLGGMFHRVNIPSLNPTSAYAITGAIGYNNFESFSIDAQFGTGLPGSSYNVAPNTPDDSYVVLGITGAYHFKVRSEINESNRVVLRRGFSSNHVTNRETETRYYITVPATRFFIASARGGFDLTSINASVFAGVQYFVESFVKISQKSGTRRSWSRYGGFIDVMLPFEPSDQYVAFVAENKKSLEESPVGFRIGAEVLAYNVVSIRAAYVKQHASILEFSLALRFGL